MKTQEEITQELIEYIKQFISKLDNEYKGDINFDKCLAMAREILENNATEQQLNDLACKLLCAYNKITTEQRLMDLIKEENTKHNSITNSDTQEAEICD